MERPEENLAEFGSAVHEALTTAASSSEEIRLARAGFLQHFAARGAANGEWVRRATPSRWRIWMLAGALTAGAAALALWAWTTRPVSFQVGASGTRGRLGELVRGASEGLLPVRFSEGSSVILHEDTRLRVQATDNRGARMVIENGTVDASIASSAIGKAHWSFEAGPFEVRVTGTRFTLTYRAHDQSFSLATHEGKVIVSGRCLSRPTPVAAGGHLDLSCPAPAATPPRMASVSPLPSPEPTDSEIPSGKPIRGAHNWRELLATGHLQEAVRAADQSGFERVCQTASAKDLLALADAARLFARTARAVTALRTLRQRFPASPEASTGAFALGRIAFEQKRAYPEAVDWFATYLRELPNGPLHGDCVGRLMEARLRAGDQAGARWDAEQYLRRFPEGPYASEARGILAK